MTMGITVRTRMTAAAIALMPALVASAASVAETFTATASIKSPQANASAPVTINIDRLVSDADRERIIAVVKGNDAAATRAALTAMEDIGSIELGKQRTPIKYAYATPSGGGRLITVLTAAPVLFAGGSLPDAKPREGFDLALAVLVVDATGKGEGELAPAAKIKTNAQGAIVTEDYGREVIHLTGVSKVK